MKQVNYTLNQEENRQELADLLTKEVGDDTIEVHISETLFYASYTIQIFAPSKIYDASNVLCGKAKDGRNRYEVVRVNIRPFEGYQDRLSVHGCPPLLKYEDEKTFPWLAEHKFQIAGFDCRERAISKATMKNIASYVKELLKKRKK